MTCTACERKAKRLAAEQRAKDRRAVCEPCEHRRGLFCGVCKCVIALKTQLAGESCPVHKW